MFNAEKLMEEELAFGVTSYKEKARHRRAYITAQLSSLLSFIPL
jgi:hypothetical protein